MVKKYLLALGTLVGVFFISQAYVHAGGCCFESVSLKKEGVAGTKPAVIEGRLFNAEYIMEQKRPKYQADQDIEVVNSQSPNVKCKPDTTNHDGKFKIECLSSQAGSFQVEVKPVSENDEAGQATPITVIFKPNPAAESLVPTSTPTPEPSATPEPTATPVVSPDLATQQRIAELEAKVHEQEDKISSLEAVIKKLETWWSRVFRFSR